MLKGGYQIINLENRNFTTNAGMQCKGIYEQINGTRKPILLSGFTFNGVEYYDTFVNVLINGSAFQLILLANTEGDYIVVKVENNDMVTVTI